MRRIAVTGTNGKTSTVEFTRQLLARGGRHAASYGTLGLVTESGRDPDPPVTIGPRAISDFLLRLEGRDLDAVTLEAYSSSLATGMFDHVSVDVAAFTNLARDHLDIHGDVEEYFRVKRSLFDEVLVDDGTAVINHDDERRDDLVACCRDCGIDVTTYGWNDGADVTIQHVEPSTDGTAVDLTVHDRRSHVDLGLVGDVMVSNACCAFAIARAAGVRLDQALDGMEQLQAPPGRLDRVGVHHGAELFVDYAHTAAALQAVLETLGTRASGELVVVFGCGGDRDRGKRRRMGEIAAKHADTAIVTDDNPRDEDPATIREEILEGCPGARERGSRERAIADALDTARDGDIVVVAGKGHERTQIVGDETRTFSDHDVIDRLIDSPESSP